MLEALMCSQDWIRNKYKGIFLLHFNIYLYFAPSWKLFFQLYVGQVTDEGKPASFWSVLQEVQEELQVIDQYHNISLFFVPFLLLSIHMLYISMQEISI